jgi:hypothetical protein
MPTITSLTAQANPRRWGAVAAALLGAVSALCVAVSSHAAGGVSADEARLSAIRQAMVDAAVNASTRVQATSWMDTQGALREYNRFTSEIRVRDIRLQEAGDVEAKARLTPVRDAVPVAAQIERVQPESCLKPAAKTTLRHVMQSMVTVSPQLAPAERYAAQQVGRAAMAAIAARGVRSNYWHLTQEPQTNRAYDRHYLGYGQEHLQWQLQLVVESGGASSVAQETPALNLRWLVRPRARQEAWLEQTDFVPPARQVINATTPRIDAAMQQAIEQSVANLARTLDERLACDPQALALNTEEGRLVLSAGDLAGLRVGDRVLLTDPRQLPQHVLEPQALDAAVLAEVKSVSAYRAELKPVTGRKQKANDKPNAAWVAWPYTY